MWQEGYSNPNLDQHPGENFLRNVVQDQYNPGSSEVADIKPEIGFGLPTNILDSQDEIRKMAELGLPTQFQQLGTSSSHVFMNSVTTNMYTIFFHEILFIYFPMRYKFLIEIKLWKNFWKNANVHFAALKRKQRRFCDKNSQICS